VERRAGHWKISHVEAIYERDQLIAAVPGQETRIPPSAVKGLRPSYRLLAWHLSRSGFTVRDDLPGDDRPEQVSRLYETVFSWLNQASANQDK
jgi:hypothetical protein